VSRPIPHGTRVAYNYHKCRCGQCSEANASYKKYRHTPKRLLYARETINFAVQVYELTQQGMRPEDICEALGEDRNLLRGRLKRAGYEDASKLLKLRGAYW
jgi:hypothetical protein